MGFIARVTLLNLTQSLFLYVVRHDFTIGRGVEPRGGQLALGGGVLLA